MANITIENDTDGYILSANLFTPKNNSIPPCATIIISGAMSVSQRFYHRIAAYLAETGGFRVITFDFRGTLQSKKLNKEQKNISFRNFGVLDLPSVIKYCLKQFVLIVMHCDLHIYIIFGVVSQVINYILLVIPWVHKF